MALTVGGKVAIMPTAGGKQTAVELSTPAAGAHAAIIDTWGKTTMVPLGPLVVGGKVLVVISASGKPVAIKAGTGGLSNVLNLAVVTYPYAPDHTFNISWDSPITATFDYVRVEYSTTGYPVVPGDGTLIGEYIKGVATTAAPVITINTRHYFTAWAKTGVSYDSASYAHCDDCTTVYTFNFNQYAYRIPYTGYTGYHEWNWGVGTSEPYMYPETNPSYSPTTEPYDITGSATGGQGWITLNLKTTYAQSALYTHLRFIGGWNQAAKRVSLTYDVEAPAGSIMPGGPGFTDNTIRIIGHDWRGIAGPFNYFYPDESGSYTAIFDKHYDIIDIDVNLTLTKPGGYPAGTEYSITVSNIAASLT